MDLENNRQYQSLLKGRDQTCGMRSGRVFLLPGEECGLHSTKEREEMLIFLAGRGEAMVGLGRRLAVAAGQVAYIPPRTEHNITNTGSEPLVYIYCVAEVVSQQGVKE